MPIQRLAHFSVCTGNLEESRKFYEDVLGLTVGFRPPFSFPGYWFYPGPSEAEDAVLHLFTAEGAIGALPDAERRGAGSGALDHIAFTASDLASTLQTLRAHGVPYRELEIPASSLHQVFVDDPSGVTIELNFATS